MQCVSLGVGQYMNSLSSTPATTVEAHDPELNLRRALQEAEKVFGPTDLAIGQLHMWLGDHYMNAGNYSLAAISYRSALTVYAIRGSNDMKARSLCKMRAAQDALSAARPRHPGMLGTLPRRRVKH
jgi:hypothetical protein